VSGLEKEGERERESEKIRKTRNNINQLKIFA